MNSDQAARERARQPAEAEALTALERKFPLWQIWTVHRYIGGTVWCARPHEDHKLVLNAGSAAELAEMIELEESDAPAPEESDL